MKSMKNRSFLVLSAIVCLLTSACSTNGGDERLTNKDEKKESVSSVSENTQEEPWRTVYDKQLNDLLSEYDEKWALGGKLYYDIHDLNGDDTPELLISEGTAHVCGCMIYTYENGELTEIGRMGEYGELAFYPDSRLIVANFTGNGHHVQRWNILSGTELKELYNEEEWMTDEKEYAYSFNSTVVTESRLKELKGQFSEYGPKEGEERIHLGRTSIYKPDGEKNT